MTETEQVSHASLIIDQVSREHGISVQQLTGSSRMLEFVRARIEATKRMKNAGLRRGEMARALGNRHPSSIDYYLKKAGMYEKAY